LSRQTLHGLEEGRLAACQMRQVGNTCSFHVIAAGLRLLLDVNIDPGQLSNEIDRLWWRGRLMRVFPGWAVTPRMQVRIVRHLARTQHLPVTASYHKGDPELLPGLLSDPDIIPIVTLIWLPRQAPPIYYDGSAWNRNYTRAAGGHSMIFAAFDPTHKAGKGQKSTPWGFINSWENHPQHLFWMTDADFRKAWRFWLPGIGPNPLVLLRRDFRVE